MGGGGVVTAVSPYFYLASFVPQTSISFSMMHTEKQTSLVKFFHHVYDIEGGRDLGQRTHTHSFLGLLLGEDLTER